MQVLRFGHEQLHAANAELAADWLHGYLHHHIGKMAGKALFTWRNFLNSRVTYTYMFPSRISAVLQQLQGQAESCNSYKDKLSLATATTTRRSTHHVALITTVWSHNCFCGFNSTCLTHCLLDLWWRILKHECEKTVCKVQLQEDCTVHIINRL